MQNIRTTALACVLLAGSTVCGTAIAADFDGPPAEYGHDWSGFYFGGHIGHGELDFNGKYTGDPGDDFLDDNGGTFELEPDGWVAGLQAGFNWQFHNIVIGAEGDLSFMDWDDTLINGSGELVETDTDKIATLRARLGLAIQQFLIYATAGLAWSDTDYYVNDHTTDPDPSENGRIDFDDVGLVAGLGAEYALGERWSLKAEGLYLNFDQDEDGSTLTHDSDSDDFGELEDGFIVRAGFNLHL